MGDATGVAIGGSSLMMGPTFVWCQHHDGWLYRLDEVLMCQSQCVGGVSQRGVSEHNMSRHLDWVQVFDAFTLG